MIVAVAMVGCGKKEASKPQTDAEGPSNAAPKESALPTKLKEPTKAEKEFTETKVKAEMGIAVAQYNLGNMYDEGVGIPKDGKKAMEWFQKSADQEYAKAQHALGFRYYYGEGVPKDNKEAVKWFLRASMQGHAFAQGILGVMCDMGEGVPKNSTSAYVWCNISALNGHMGSLRYKNNILAKKMSPVQIAEAQRLANEMIKKNPKLIKEKK